MNLDLDQMPERAQAQVNCPGVAVGKIRTEVLLERGGPFTVALSPRRDRLRSTD